jgi:hypothetical protein
MADNKTLTLHEKLMHIQHELKAPKNLRNNFGGYNYRNAESILEALKPLLVKYGATVTITDTIEDIGGRIYVKATATIYDSNASAMPIGVEAYAREAETKKGMDDAQVTGATSSYARKYALNGLFLLDDTQDVDTEAYQKAERGPQSAPQASSNKTTPKAKAKPQSKPQTATQTAPIPQQAPQTDPEVMELRKQLREVMKKYDIDNAVVVTACNLGPNSTADDYREALNYCESVGGIIGGAES